MNFFVSLALTVTGLASAIAVAACTESTPPRQTEQRFVESAASRSILEVRLADFALSHSASEEVRDFARTMVEHHTLANRSLADAAQQDRFAVPLEMSAEDSDDFIRLTHLRGGEFDRAYVLAAVEGHEEALAAYQLEAARSQSEVGKWAAATLPMLEQHLAQARELSATAADFASAPI